MHIVRFSAIQIMLYNSTHNITALLKGRKITKKNPISLSLSLFLEKMGINNI